LLLSIAYVLARRVLSLDPAASRSPATGPTRAGGRNLGQLGCFAGCLRWGWGGRRSFLDDDQPSVDDVCEHDWPKLGGGAVFSAYRAAWHAFEHALADANPSDPLLTATMVDPQLQGVKANLPADQRQGIVGRGTFMLHPKIVSMSATTATVVDCAHSTAALVYKGTGKPVPPVTPPENDGVTATMVLTGGTSGTRQSRCDCA
jgi:hypothetical protein